MSFKIIKAQVSSYKKIKAKPSNKIARKFPLNFTSARLALLREKFESTHACKLQNESCKGQQKIGSKFTVTLAIHKKTHGRLLYDSGESNLAQSTSGTQTQSK
jgi:hypothetical protein